MASMVDTNDKTIESLFLFLLFFFSSLSGFKEIYSIVGLDASTSRSGEILSFRETASRSSLRNLDSEQCENWWHSSRRLIFEKYF